MVARATGAKIAALLIAILALGVVSFLLADYLTLSVYAAMAGLAVAYAIGLLVAKLRGGGQAGFNSQAAKVSPQPQGCVSLHPDLVASVAADGTVLDVLARGDLPGCEGIANIANAGNWAGVGDRVHLMKAMRDCAEELADQTVLFRLDPLCRLSDRSSDKTAAKWFEARCRPMGDGKRLMVFVRDLTAYKTLEEELAHQRAEAECVGITKSRFLAVMSHELRTPLNAIVGFSELLHTGQYDQTNPENRMEYYRIIHNSGLHLLSILNDVLDVSKIEAGKYEIFPEPFDLVATVTECRDIMVGIAVTRGIEIQFADSGQIPDMVGDRRAVRQIMLNLLSNAVKFSPDNSKVMIGIERVGRKVMISVTDTGIGMSEDHVARIGEPFLQENSSYDRERDGTGLGLYVAKGLTNLHDGDLIIESALDQGTKVTVAVPIAGAQSGPRPGTEHQKLVRLDRPSRQSGETKKTLREAARG